MGSGQRGGHLGRRRHLPLSDLCEMGRHLLERDRQRPQLPVDRLGRRHQADHGPHGYVGATEPLAGEGARGLAANSFRWPMVMGGIVPVVNVVGVKANDITPRAAPRCAKSSSAKSRVGTTHRSRQLNPRRCPASPPTSPLCIAPTDRAPPSTSTATLRRSPRRLEGPKSATADLCTVAFRHRRQG